MLRFMDGFDHYASADILNKWTGLYVSGSLSATIAGYLVVGATGRNSGGGVTISSASASIGLRKGLDNQATWIVGAAIKFTAITSSTADLIRFLDNNSTQCEIRIDSSGHLIWSRNGTTLATGTTALAAGSFYYIEVMVTIASSVATGACVLSINGVPEITLASGTSTKTTSNAYANTIEFLARTSTYVVLDDVYICDGTGSINNTMLGDVRVEALYPTGAGATTQWTPLSGSNYANVNETAEDGDTTYIAAAGITSKDTYAMGDLSSSPSSIFGVQTVLTARKDDAGSRLIAPVIRSGGADYDGATVSVGDSYTMALEIRELDPNGSVAWTPSAVNAMEAGVKLVG